MRGRASMKKTLSEYVDDLQSHGRYTFTQVEARSTLKMSQNAFLKAKALLIKKNRLTSPKSLFYVIVPQEYRSAGTPPVTWYIDDLMKFLGQSYYVGLLSAAELHGSAHQAPQEFQVVVPSTIRSIEDKRVRIRFLKKGDMQKSPTTKLKTQTGYFIASTPETTAFDLVRYYKSAGYLSHVMVVLSELTEKLDSKRLLAIAKMTEIELSLSQRLGFLLDQVDKNLTKDLNRWVQLQKPFPTLLRPGYNQKISTKNEKWNIVVNETLEADL